MALFSRTRVSGPHILHGRYFSTAPLEIVLELPHLGKDLDEVAPLEPDHPLDLWAMGPQEGVGRLLELEGGRHRRHAFFPQLIDLHDASLKKSGQGQGPRLGLLLGLELRVVGLDSGGESRIALGVLVSTVEQGVVWEGQELLE